MKIELSEGLGGSQEGIKDFWSLYVYNCLEQQISRAISLNDKKMWEKIEAKLGAYIDGQGLLKFFPAPEGQGSVALTSYILSVAHEAGFKFSDQNENLMLGALTSYVEGRLKETTEFSRADESLKKVSALEALSRYRRMKVDSLTSIDYQGTQWPLYTLVEWYQIHLWEKSVPQRTQKLVDLENLLRSRFYFSAKRSAAEIGRSGKNVLVDARL